ncbi:MAG: hypothetical protein IPK85_04205 [Gemmatimonadetes bacterium]|nr:hypothetical protein [Gemmatimonadota bacterium]
MADRWWIGGANDGDWGNTNNWAATRYGAGAAGVPATGDSVFIWDTDQAITQNLNQAGVDLALLDIRFGGVIGTNSTSLTIAVSNGSAPVLNYAGTGAFCNITAGTNGIDLIHVIRTAGPFRLAGGTTAEVRCGAVGRIEVAAAAVISLDFQTAGMDAEIDDNATAMNLLVIGGGKTRSFRSAAGAYINSGAVLTIERDAAFSGSAYVMGGGRLEWKSSGNLTYIISLPGSVATTAGNQNLFTVSAAYKYEGSNQFDNEPGVTFTTGPIPYGATR